jgi:hypothetical protein
MKKSLIFLAPVFLLAVGCSHMVKPNVTPLQFVPEAMTMLGPVEGEVSYGSFLGIAADPPDDDGYTTLAATKAALSKVHGDAILNPSVDEDVQSYFGIYYVYTLRVSGQAVRYNKQLQPDPTPTPSPTATPFVWPKLPPPPTPLPTPTAAPALPSPPTF